MNYVMTQDGFTPAVDNIFGLSKKEKEQKSAKKEAIKLAEAKGLSGRTARAMGRAAKLEVKAEQKGDKASNILLNRVIKTEARASGLEAKDKALESGASKRTAKAIGKAVEAEINTGRKETGLRKVLNIATLGIVKKDPSERSAIQAAKQSEKATQFGISQGKRLTGEQKRLVRDAGQEVKADILDEKGKGKRAERIRARDGETGIQRFGEDVITAPLLPFKKKMRSMLKSEGIPAPDRMADLAQVFYDNIVKRSDSYSPIQSAFMNSKTMSKDHAAVILPVVVDAIISFFKMSRDKRDAGEPISKIEEQAADATDVVEKQLEEKAKEEGAQTLGEKLLFDTKFQLIVAGVILTIIVIAVKLSK